MNVPSDLTPPDFEARRLVHQNGAEYWRARHLQPLLGYDVWENFERVIERAQDACVSVGETVRDHFLEATEMVDIGSGATRERRDFILSRYACYLIAMNGDPRKAEIGAAQTYFAVQTRRMELEDALSVDEKRLALREKVTQSHKRVSSAAKGAGVRSHMQGVFHDARFRGLYGMSTAQVKLGKGLKASDNLFDHAGPLELSANDFQMNLAADVIEQKKIRGEQAAINTNLSAAKEVRRAIIDSGATLPEDLPLAEPIANVRKRLSPPRAKKPTSLKGG